MTAGDSAHAPGQGLAHHQCGSRRRANEVALKNAEIPFPDGGDAVEDRNEQHALREDVGRQEIELAGC
jgi:hypothetical protein